MIFVGIDPGLAGAVAALDSAGEVIGVWDMPVLTVEKNRSERKEPNIAAMVEILTILKYREPTGRPKVLIEKVGSMPDQGVASAFTFGVGYGLWLGIIAALDLPCDRVHPTRWKSRMLDGMGKTKDADRLRAIDIFGSQVSLNRVKDHGRADALLLAEYRRRIG